MFNAPDSDRDVVACSQCDMLQRLPALDSGASARCPRCNNELWRRRPDPLNRTLALTLTAVILFIVANCVPMLGLSVVGRKSFTTVIGGAVHLWNNDERIVAVLALFTTVLAPAVQLGVLLAVVLAALRDPVPRWAGALLRHHPTARTWSMLEVMLLGVLVALIKIADYATVLTGPALYTIVALIFVLAAIQASFDPRVVWDRIEWADDAAHDPKAHRIAEVSS